MPVQTQIKFRAIKKPSDDKLIKQDKKRNKRAKSTIDFIDSENNVASPSKQIKQAVAESPSKHKRVSKALFPENLTSKKSSINSTKQSIQSIIKVLHCATAEDLPCRESEIKAIKVFVNNCIEKQSGGSLYISGAAGTGKSACLTKIIEGYTQVKSCFINCMSFMNPSKLFLKVSDCFGSKCKSVTDRNAVSSLRKLLLSGRLKLIVLDEIDQLDTKNHHVLSSFFEWAGALNSKLILIGIANSLNLTDCIHPILECTNSQPQLLHFKPYSNEQIYTILQSRLGCVENYQEHFEDTALQFLSRKVASTSGDIRNALNLCERAIELAERISRANVLKCTSDDGFNPGSPSKAKSCKPIVNITIVMQVLQSLQSSTSVAVLNNTDFPIVQKVAIATLLFYSKNGLTKDCLIGKWYDIYKVMLAKRKMDSVSFSEFSNLCMLLESRGFLTVKVGKEPRQSKVYLRLQESEVEEALEDHTLFVSIMTEDKTLFKRL